MPTASPPKPSRKNSSKRVARSPSPIITLLTDFGTQDPFVGIMKGVILGICPEATVVDLCHDLTPFEIPEAGFTLCQSFRYFPAGSIHVVVVDPGVGSDRRPLLVEAFGHRFIGPDNGLFTMLFRDAKSTGAKTPYKVRAITNPKVTLPEVSNTFHGRDVFAPAAAHLAAGRKVSSFGPRVEDAVRQEWDLPVRTGKRFWSGSVFKVDRFGNLITNFASSAFPLVPGTFELQAGMERISQSCGCYADAKPGELVLIAGSSGYWEIALNQSSAAKKLGLVAGSPLELAIFG